MTHVQLECFWVLSGEAQALEDLSLMPANVARPRQWSARSGPELTIGQLVDLAAGDCAITRNLNAAFIGESQHPSVQQLVVQRAQRQAVVEVVGPVLVEAPDVRGLEAHRDGGEVVDELTLTDLEPRTYVDAAD